MSPEIRANCTLRICLRTTDESESRDVLGGPEAAFLPVDRPGRAYVRTGGGAPTRAPGGPRGDPSVRRRHDGSGDPPVGVARRPASAGGRHRIPRRKRPGSAGRRTDPALRSHRRRRATPALAVAASRRAHTRSPRGAGARPPPGSDPDAPGSAGPPRSSDTGGARGGSRRGRGLAGGRRPAQRPPPLLRSILAEAVSRLAPADLHVHVIEAAGGGLADDAAGLPHTGTSIRGAEAAPDHPSRRPADVGGGRASRRGCAHLRSLILLLIDGVDAVNAVLDEAEPATGSAALLRLLRDGAAVGLTCVLTGDRALPGSRLAAAVRGRLVLPLPDRAEYAMAGVPAAAVPTHRPPGRALLGEQAVECQLVLPRPLPSVRAHCRPERIGRQRCTSPNSTLTRRCRSPHAANTARPTPTPWPCPWARAATRAGHWSGPHAHGRTARDRSPGSGRSSALEAFAQHLTARGARVLRVGHRFAGRSGAEPGGDWMDPEDVEGARRWLDDRSGNRAWSSRTTSVHRRSPRCSTPCLRWAAAVA